MSALQYPLDLERALQESELRFRQLAENIDDVLWVADTRIEQFIYVGPAFERIWGLPCEAVYRDGTAWQRHVHPDDLQKVTEVLQRARVTGLGFRTEYRIVRPDGALRWIYSRAFPIVDEAGSVYRLAGVASDITERKQAEERIEQLRYLAYYDALTGLANSTLFHDRLPGLIEAAQRGGHQLAMLVLDVERFKRINDTLGRHAGDQLLKELARRLSRGLPEAALARVGADRFAIVFDQVRNDAHLVHELEERLHAWLDEPIRVGDTELRIACKVGIALHPNDGCDAHALFGHAEAALKRAKATGDRYVFYAQQMSERIAEQLALENKLRLAIEREEFVLHYQPKVDAATRRIVGLEALIRWQSPELGLVPPMKFIPLLEETGLILPVGAWALRRAVLDQRAWRAAGLAVPRVAVNVSAIQLRQPDFVATVRAALEGEACCGLDIEITESLVMQDIQANIAKIADLRALGCEVAIDDFGTGYSSLAYLAKLPVHDLKVDRSFVSAMVDDPAVMTLVASVVSMAHAMRLKVVAEGVETEAQAGMLHALGCELLQGYLISKPVAPAMVAALLQREGQPSPPDANSCASSSISAFTRAGT